MLRHLKIFTTVYNEKSMTAAANKLFMTQPSVSQAIKELESKYEVILFERLSKKLYVTASGEKLYQYAIHIIKLVDEMEDSLREDSFAKKLVVGANYTIGVVLIHKYINNLKKLYPEVEVMVVVNKSSVLKEMLRKNEIDLALIEEITNPVDLVQDIFYDDKIVIAAHPEHSLFLQKTVIMADIVKEKLLLREKGAGVRNLFEARMNQVGLIIKPYWESTSTTALINAAEKKIGIAVLPFQLVKKHILSGSLKKFEVQDMNLSRKLAIVHHKNKFLTETIKAFIKACHNL